MLEFGKQDIEYLLRLSVQTGIAVSLKMKGQSPIFTGIVTYSSADGVIELRPLTLHGTPIQKTSVNISELEKVTPLSVYYDDPVYERLRRIKGLIKAV